MDNLSSNTNLVLDDLGVCNNCKSFELLAKKTIWRPHEDKTHEMMQVVGQIKNDGKEKKYDCVLGLSGGVDSSYLAYEAKKLGLRPLLVHFDNGWNSELAVGNIQNIVEKLGLELYTYVVDWEEFKDLQLAYLKASVIDIEAITDHFISAVIHEIAYKNRIKYILNGSNIATEFTMGSFRWTYKKLDLNNLLSIHNKFGTIPLKKYPKLGFYQRYFYYQIYGIKQVDLLNYMDYNLEKAKTVIKQKLGWRDYGGKHHESIFTRFYQGYILPVKFNVDKRKWHLSNLIWSGQISREYALEELRKPPYSARQQDEDKEYVCKKLGVSAEIFDEWMRLPVVPHEYYGTENDEIHHKKRVWFVRFFKIPGMLFFIRLLIRLRIV